MKLIRKKTHRNDYVSCTHQKLLRGKPMNIGIISKNQNLISDLLIELESRFRVTAVGLKEKSMEFRIIVLDNGSYTKEEIYEIVADLTTVYEGTPVLSINILNTEMVEEYKTLLEKAITIIRNFGITEIKKAKKAELVDQIYIAHEVIFDVGRQKLIKNNNQCILTSQEYKILFYLVKNIGQIISTDRLLEITDIASKKCLYVHINSLREKLEPNPGMPTLLVTIFKSGYVLQNNLVANYHSLSS